MNRTHWRRAPLAACCAALAALALAAAGATAATAGTSCCEGQRGQRCAAGGQRGAQPVGSVHDLDSF